MKYICVLIAIAFASCGPSNNQSLVVETPEQEHPRLKYEPLGSEPFIKDKYMPAQSAYIMTVDDTARFLVVASSHGLSVTPYGRVEQ